MRAHVEIRSQKSRGSGNNRFGGPDTYVAVQIVPEGVTPLLVLNHRHAAKRGVTIKRFGQGYHEHRSLRSSLGKAIRAAETFAAAFNAGQQ